MSTFHSYSYLDINNECVLINWGVNEKGELVSSTVRMNSNLEIEQKDEA